MLDKVTISNQATMLRKKLGEDETSPIDIFSIASNIENMSILLYPLGERISGACVKTQGSVLIAINSTMSLGRQRFSLAHELYHFYYDASSTKTICQTAFSVDNETERAADMFASYFLVPSASLYSKMQAYTCSGIKIQVEDILKLEQFYQVSRRAIIVRLLNDGYLREPVDDEFYQGVIKTAAKLGYDTALYKPISDSQITRTLGHYIKSVNRLYNEQVISYRKYEGLLKEAFREDLLQADSENEGENVD